MRITTVLERPVGLRGGPQGLSRGTPANALVDFSGHTVSLVAVIADRDGGHLINLHIAAGLGVGGCESYPEVFQPFGGYPDSCVVTEARSHRRTPRASASNKRWGSPS